MQTYPTNAMMKYLLKSKEEARSIEQGAKPISGALEVVIKIQSFPSDAKNVEHGLKQFDVVTGNQTVTVKVNPKAFKKLEQAQANYPQWVAAIAGQVSEHTEMGFIMTDPNIQLIFHSSLG